MLDLVPLARARRVVAYGYRYPQPIGQALQMNFPGAWPRTVAAASVRADQQASCLRIGFPSHQLPPAANALPRKFRRLMRDTYIDHRFVSGHVVGPIRDGLAHALGGEIVDIDRLRVARRPPATTAIVKF